MMRVENIGDLYDNATAQTVNLDQLMKTMWENANGKSFDSSEFNFEFTEMSLTGNMPLSEMLSRKIKWQTVDDKNDEPSFLDYSNDSSAIKLEPQRIRQFKIECKSVKS